MELLLHLLAGFLEELPAADDDVHPALVYLDYLALQLLADVVGLSYFWDGSIIPRVYEDSLKSGIYTKGDVYINADIKYKTSRSSNYNDITSVRIDARNIYVNGEVEDLEVMLLAREGFHSGVSKKQLRILGDVIAKNTFWEREPLLEYDVEEVNKPSEYIIEDMRKYIVPAPGDTELPDDYTIWRQVNPATGEVLDSY